MRVSPANVFNAIALAGISAILLVTLAQERDMGIDPMTTASTTSSAPRAVPPQAHSADRFMVVDHNGGKTCIFALHRSEGYDVHRVEPADNCASVSNRLTDARAWQEMPNGAVTITDRAGQPILRLGPSDGFAYEVTEPTYLALSLEAY